MTVTTTEYVGAVKSYARGFSPCRSVRPEGKRNSIAGKRKAIDNEAALQRAKAPSMVARFAGLALERSKERQAQAKARQAREDKALADWQAVERDYARYVCRSGLNAPSLRPQVKLTVGLWRKAAEAFRAFAFHDVKRAGYWLYYALWKIGQAPLRVFHSSPFYGVAQVSPLKQCPGNELDRIAQWAIFRQIELAKRRGKAWGGIALDLAAAHAAEAVIMAFAATPDDIAEAQRKAQAVPSKGKRARRHLELDAPPSLIFLATKAARAGLADDGHGDGQGNIPLDYWQEGQAPVDNQWQEGSIAGRQVWRSAAKAAWKDALLAQAKGEISGMAGQAVVRRARLAYYLTCGARLSDKLFRACGYGSMQSGLQSLGKGGFQVDCRKPNIAPQHEAPRWITKGESSLQYLSAEERESVLERQSLIGNAIKRNAWRKAQVSAARSGLIKPSQAPLSDTAKRKAWREYVWPFRHDTMVSNGGKYCGKLAVIALKRQEHLHNWD